MDTRILLMCCLFAGVLINIGLRGMGWIASLIVPGLMIGFVFYLIIEAMRWMKRT